MRGFTVVFVISNIVLVTSLSAENDTVTVFKDNDNKDDDYSDEDSTSESNEVESYNEVTNDTNGDSIVNKKPLPIVNTEAHVNGTQCNATKENKKKSSTTLVNYPFAVSIQRKGSHYANGALIDKRWILSSAAEFYNVRESLKLFRVRMGSVDCKRGGIIEPLKRIEIHPLYKYGSPDYDVALVRVAQPVEYTEFIKPIGLSNIQTKIVSAKFMTTYWPRLIINGQILPPKAAERVKPYSMRVSTQRLIPKELCLLNVNVTLEESTLCLHPFTSHHSHCVPDSGAPVIAEDGLWGITSGWTSTDCNVTQSPTVFSRIATTEIRSWLDIQMKNS